VNPNQPSRPFLRLFSGLSSAEAAETGGQSGAGAGGTTENRATESRPMGRRGTAGNGGSRNRHGFVGGGRPVASTSNAATADSKKTRDGHWDDELQSNESMIAGSVGPKRVEVSLGEIAPVLADAINHRRGWLTDFADDTVSIDADLYEVLLAYQQMRRLNAA